jgi:hypothetical protein
MTQPALLRHCPSPFTAQKLYSQCLQPLACNAFTAEIIGKRKREREREREREKERERERTMCNRHCIRDGKST